MSEQKSEQDLVAKWKGKVDKSVKAYEKYCQTVDDTRKAYVDFREKNIKGKYNVFWSSIETQKPFLYFKQPQPYIKRTNNSTNSVEALACKILEKAIAWNLQQFDFDSVIKYARNDYLISGTGVLWVAYKPKFEDVINPNKPDELVEVKTDEMVAVVYVDPKDFIADCDKVGIWENVSWIGRKIFMTKKELIDQFGEDVAVLVVEDNEKDYAEKQVCIYEIWDKVAKKAYWLYEKELSKFLKVLADPMKLSGFFPCPKPIFGTMANDSLIPVSDYEMIEEMLNELDGIVNRMEKVTAAFKISGAYDNSFPELSNILSKDVTLVSVNDYTKLRENGGLAGIIDFVPIEQYIRALEALALRRQDILAQIYDITGVSDILRGNSDPNDTATAVAKKTNFGTLRNQDRQNDMQRFICDLFKLMAEVICEQFSEEKLLSFLGEIEVSPEVASMAVKLLKQEKTRKMSINIETDTVFDQDGDASRTLAAIETINNMIEKALAAVNAQPKLLPLYRQMIETVVATMPKARPYEEVIEKIFVEIEQELANQQQPEQPDMGLMLAQTKMNQDFEIKKQQNAIAEQKAIADKNYKDGTLALKSKEMDLQVALKQEQILQGDLNPAAANISTGLVRGF